jgi:flavin reductase (DIM6/NTAB) family NADH-FMN oxidoreductase RutF
MIRYGIYVLTADDGKGAMGTATVNWVTQSAFNPPLVVAGVKADCGAYAALGAVACKVTSVVESHLHHTPAGRPDAAIVEMTDLGASVFYGG